ncbi:MAG: transposase [Burkholderia sp.]
MHQPHDHAHRTVSDRRQARLLEDQPTCRVTHSFFKKANLLCMTTVAHVKIGQFITHSKFNRGKNSVCPPHTTFGNNSDEIAAHCNPENKVLLDFVERLNNKIRVIQQRVYGLRDEEYLRLKILTCILPKI